MPVPENIRALERPHPDLLKYYIIIAAFTGPAIIASLPYLFFRYHTLRYRLDDEGIHMKVGILFRREINLTSSKRSIQGGNPVFRLGKTIPPRDAGIPRRRVTSCRQN